MLACQILNMQYVSLPKLEYAICERLKIEICNMLFSYGARAMRGQGHNRFLVRFIMKYLKSLSYVNPQFASGAAPLDPALCLFALGYITRYLGLPKS